MTEQATAEFTVYGQNESEGALVSRRQLPVEVQLALPNIMHELCADPKDYPPDQIAFSVGELRRPCSDGSTTPSAFG